MRAPSEHTILSLQPSHHSKSHMCGVSNWRRTTCHKKCCLSSSQRSFPHLFAFVSQVFLRALLVINWIKNLNKMALVLFFFFAFYLASTFLIELLFSIWLPLPPTHTHTQLVGPVEDRGCDPFSPVQCGGPGYESMHWNLWAPEGWSPCKPFLNSQKNGFQIHTIEATLPGIYIWTKLYMGCSFSSEQMFLQKVLGTEG